MTEDNVVALPGLEPQQPAASSRTPTRLEAAAQAHIEQLKAAGLLGPEHALACAIVLDLAQLASHAKAYAAAQVHKELREAMAALPSEATADAWAQLRDWLSAEANADHPEDFTE